jgi:FkbM family methyltransferase
MRRGLERLAQAVNDGAVDHQGRTLGRACGWTRQRILRHADPLVTRDIAGRNLLMPLSHALPHYVQRYPLYSRNVGQLARATHESGRPDVFVDVGANVGDTVAWVLDAVPSMRMLCIDGDPTYVGLLRHNVRALDNVTTLGPILLADTRAGVRGGISPVDGTARVVGGQFTTPTTTLDEVIAQHPEFHEPTILKSDTDGFEAHILRGATSLITRCHPVLHFEYDPRLLAEAGSDGPALLTYLAECGYEHVLAYDNLGCAMTTCRLTDPVLGDLHAYVLRDATAYLDLVVAPPDAREIIDRLVRDAGLRR